MGSDFYCEQVLSGRTPVERICETEHALAFYHTRPAYEHHIVVIPKKHIPSLIEMDPGDEPILHAVIALVRKIAAQVVEQKGACRVITNLGNYQDSKHLHFHVVSGTARRDST